MLGTVCHINSDRSWAWVQFDIDRSGSKARLHCDEFKRQGVEPEIGMRVDVVKGEGHLTLADVLGQEDELVQMAERLTANCWDVYLKDHPRNWREAFDEVLRDGRALAKEFLAARRNSQKS